MARTKADTQDIIDDHNKRLMAELITVDGKLVSRSAIECPCDCKCENCRLHDNDGFPPYYGQTV